MIPYRRQSFDVGLTAEPEIEVDPSLLSEASDWVGIVIQLEGMHAGEGARLPSTLRALRVAGRELSAVTVAASDPKIDALFGRETGGRPNRKNFRLACCPRKENRLTKTKTRDKRRTANSATGSERRQRQAAGTTSRL
jgi:hypothetical protein